MWDPLLAMVNTNYSLGEKVVDKIKKISKILVLILYGMFYNRYFAIFYQKTSKFTFWVARCVLAIKSKHSYFLRF